MPHKIDIQVGQILGNQKILSELDKLPNSKIRRFHCECIKCGNISDKYMNILLRSKTGCMCTKKSLKGIKRGSKYTPLQHKLYSVFCMIKQRCNNKNYIQYDLYGGRGIKCEWESFNDFWDDMGATYQAGLSIDRKDNNGNYSKENCRWADDFTQNNNRRNNIKTELGITTTEWARIKGYDEYRNHIRELYKDGFDLNKIQEIIEKRKSLKVLKTKKPIKEKNKIASMRVTQYTLKGNFIVSNKVSFLVPMLNLKIEDFENVFNNGQDVFNGYIWKKIYK